MRERRAVVDVGSNSVTTVVAERGEGSGGGWTPILDLAEVTALGEGTKEAGLLKPEAIARTLAAVARAAERARDLGARTAVAATMAARLASNAGELVARAAAQGTPLVVLSGEEEARLGTAAIVGDPRYAGAEDLAILDLGGHSTELTILGGGAVRFQRSLPIGTLGLRAELPQETVAGPEMLGAALALDREIEGAYDRGAAPFPAFGTVVALGAGATTLVLLREGLTAWDAARVDGAALEYEEVGRAVGWLMGMTEAGRAERLPMQPGLARTIHLSALILERLLYALRAEGCRVSVRGWRHGLLEDDALFARLAR